MIRERKTLQVYPSKTILEDLVTRSGPATSESYTPFRGREEDIISIIPIDQRDRYNVRDFLTANMQFEFNPEQIDETFEDGKKRTVLEDFISDGIEHPRIEKYVRQCVYAYTRHKTSPFNKKRLQTYNTSISYGDDDSVFDMRMKKLQSEDEVDITEYNTAVLKLPFYIKAIWAHSLAYRSNLFSFIIAYICILKENNGAPVTVRDFNHRALYALDVHGNLMKKYVHEDDNKTDKYKNVLKIFTTDQRPDILSLIHGFMQTCKILEIEFEYEDPLIFTSEFVNRLICKYLPSSEEYFEYYGEVDVEVIYALKNNNALFAPKANIYRDPNLTLGENVDNGYVANVEEKIECIYTMYQIQPDRSMAALFLGSEEDARTNIWYALKYQTKEPNEVIDMAITHLDFTKGYLVYFKDKPLRFSNNGMLGKYKGIDTYDVYFTIYGSAIAATYDVEDLLVMSQSDVQELLWGRLHDMDTEKGVWISL